MTQGGPASAGQDVPEAVLAHYLSRPDVIRQRAQHAAAIAGAAAAVLIAAGGVAELYRYPWPIELVLACAILAWISAVAAYMNVVAHYAPPVSAVDESGNIQASTVLLQDVARNAADARNRLQRAQYVGLLALVLTALAFVAGAWYAEVVVDEPVLSRVVVSDDLAEAVGTVCGPNSQLRDGPLDFRAEIRLNELALSFVELRVSDARCRSGDKVKIRVPTDAILSAAPVKDG